MKQTKNGLKTLCAAGLILSVLSMGSCNKEAQKLPSIQSSSSDESVLVGTPIAWWKFDSSWKQTVGNLPGLPHNGVKYTSTANAKYGKAAFLSLDSGFSTNNSVPAKLAGIDTALTVDFWIFATAPQPGGAQCLFALPQTGSFWPNMHVLLDGYNPGQGDSMLIKTMFKANKPGVTYIEQWVDAGGIPNGYNHWTHIQFSYRGSTSKYTLKVNGHTYVDHRVLYNNDPMSGGTPLGSLAFINTHGFVVGAFQNTWDPVLFGAPQPWMLKYKGRIDQLKIYNTALF